MLMRLVAIRLAASQSVSEVEKFTVVKREPCMHKSSRPCGPAHDVAFRSVTTLAQFRVSICKSLNIETCLDHDFVQWVIISLMHMSSMLRRLECLKDEQLSQLLWDACCASVCSVILTENRLVGQEFYRVLVLWLGGDICNDRLSQKIRPFLAGWLLESGLSPQIWCQESISWLQSSESCLHSIFDLNILSWLLPGVCFRVLHGPSQGSDSDMFCVKSVQLNLFLQEQSLGLYLDVAILY